MWLYYLRMTVWFSWPVMIIVYGSMRLWLTWCLCTSIMDPSHHMMFLIQWLIMAMCEADRLEFQGEAMFSYCLQFQDGEKHMIRALVKSAWMILKRYHDKPLWTIMGHQPSILSNINNSRWFTNFVNPHSAVVIAGETAKRKWAMDEQWRTSQQLDYLFCCLSLLGAAWWLLLVVAGR